MRATLGAAVLAAGLIGSASAALAMEDWDGFVALTGSYSQLNLPSGTPPGVKFELMSADVRASVAKGFPMNWGVQIDGILNREEIRITELGVVDSYGVNHGDAAVHVFYRQPKWLAGVIGQFGASWDGDPGDIFYRYFVGVEGQIYCGNFTYYGQVAYHAIFEGSDSIGGIAAAFQARYYLTDNWRLVGAASYSRLVDSGYGYGTLTLKAGTEYQFARSGLSAFVNYRYQHLKIIGSSGGALELNGVVGGFKWSFGAPSMKARDHGGAGLDPFDTDELIF